MARTGEYVIVFSHIGGMKKRVGKAQGDIEMDDGLAWKGEVAISWICELSGYFSNYNKRWSAR